MQERSTENEPDPLGGRYERSPDGRLNGVLREYAKFKFDRKVTDRVSDAEAIAQLQETFNEAAKFGITSLQDMSSIMTPNRCVALLEKIPVPIRVRVMRMEGTTATERDTHKGWLTPVSTNPLIRKTHKPHGIENKGWSAIQTLNAREFGTGN